MSLVDGPAAEEFYLQPLVISRETERKVLDHGYVRLVDSMGSDLSVSRAARVSYDAPPRPEDRKLIEYLWSHKHTTPFESVTFTFEVFAPISPTIRQWHRHRTQSYNELSARYKELPEIFYLPDANIVGVQSKDSKQGRSLARNDEMFVARRQDQIDRMREQNESAFALYRELLADDWPRELARVILPMGTYSHMFTTMNLLNLLRFLSDRTPLNAQREIRVYAEAMVELARGVVPVCIDVWEKTQNNGTNKV